MKEKETDSSNVTISGLNYSCAYIKVELESLGSKYWSFDNNHRIEFLLINDAGFNCLKKI